MKSKFDYYNKISIDKTASTKKYRQFFIDTSHFKLSAVLLYSLFMFFFNCASQTSSQKHLISEPDLDSASCVIDTRYPRWFFNPPIETVTGYYHDTVSAVTDAKIRMAGYKKMLVYGTSRYYEDGLWHDMQDSISFLFDEKDTARLSLLQTIDSFFTCCTGYLHLYSNKQIPVDTSRVYPCGFSSDTKISRNPQRLYASGEAHFEYYNQSICWMRAEEGAVKELCNQALHRFSSLTRNNNSEVTTAIQKKFELLVKNIRIDQRIFDNEHRICKVFISCPFSDITPLFREINNE